MVLVNILTRSRNWNSNHKYMVMAKKIFFIPLMSAIVGLVYFSCNKRPSCESCTDRNKPPIARAGRDETVVLPVNNVLLNGSASNDPDGTISEYYWSKISGPNSFSMAFITGPTPQVTSLAEGVYEFKLTVIDNKGYASSDTVKNFVVYPELRNEMKFENLTWEIYHDPNNPIDDDLYITTPPILRSALGSLFRVFVKPASSSNWVEAKTIINGEFSTPFTYFVITHAVDSVYIQVSSFPWDTSLPGTIASLRINY